MHPVNPFGSPKYTSPIHHTEYLVSPSSSMIPLEQLNQEIEQQAKAILQEYDKLQGLISRENEMEDAIERTATNTPENERLVQEYKRILQAQKQSRLNLQTLEQTLLKYCNSIINQKAAITSLPVVFSKISGVKDTELLCKILTRKTSNIVKFLERVLATTSHNLTKIFDSFFVSSHGIEFKDVQLELKVLGDETHYGGASAVLVSFVCSGRDVGKVVYKPRSAETEYAIIELFRKLNREYGHSRLPEYTILSLNDCSFWEYIEGEHLSVDADVFLDQVNLSPTDQEVAVNHLAYLNSICKCIGVTDLHRENVIFVRPSLQMVPIDMEVIKHGHVTGLYGHQEAHVLQLSDNEQALIKQFNDAQKTRVSRNTPVATYILMDLMSNFKVSGDENLVKQARIAILTGLVQDQGGVKILIKDEVLDGYLMEDLSRGDLPIFCQKDNILYYGNVFDGHKIAIYKSKEDV